MKCSACYENKCDGKYKNRHMCLGVKEAIKCTCHCHIELSDVIKASTASIATGACLVAGQFIPLIKRFRILKALHKQEELASVCLRQLHF